MNSTFASDNVEVIRNRTFDEIAVGDQASIERKLTAADIQVFAAMSGDVNPQHVDTDFAAAMRFHGVIAHGMWGIVREIGALTAVLGGLDMLAFTAGVGEHSPVLRERICRALHWLGVETDDEANRTNAATISHRSSRVRVAVEANNEEWVAASHALAALR
jgi:acetate kinase